jgi:hypothetical protein
LAWSASLPALADDGPIVAHSEVRFGNFQFTVEDLRPDDGIDAVSGFQFEAAPSGYPVHWLTGFSAPPSASGASHDQSELDSSESGFFGRGLLEPLPGREVSLVSGENTLVLSSTLRASTLLDILESPPANPLVDKDEVNQVGSLAGYLMQVTLPAYSAVRFQAEIETTSSIDLAAIQALQGTLADPGQLNGSAMAAVYMNATTFVDLIEMKVVSHQSQLMNPDSLGPITSLHDGGHHAELQTFTIINDRDMAMPGLIYMNMRTDLSVTRNRPIPEPATYALMSLGLVGVSLVVRRTRRATCATETLSGC